MKIRKDRLVLSLILSMLLLFTGVTCPDLTENLDTISTPIKTQSMANYVPENTWYHDCSNFTDFDGTGNDTWLADYSITVDGTMNSTNGYIYADNYGGGGSGHGPLRYHTLSFPIRVSQFISLEAEVELDLVLPNTNEFGHIMVILYDEFENEILTLFADQTWDDGVPGPIESYAKWKFLNGTTIETPTDNFKQEPYHDTIKISQNETGLFASFPDIGNYSLLDHDSIESNRVIKYLAIYIGAVMSFPPCDILRIHDLLLTYDISPPVIQGPVDIHYNEFTTGHSINWNVSDANPYNYTIFINGTPETSGDWDGSNFDIDIDNQSLGIYNYTLLVSDIGGSTSADTVLVFVHDVITPEISSPPDLEFEEGSSDQVISWVATDAHPDRYQILVNDTIHRSDLWNTTGETFTVSLENIDPGFYNYTCCIFDTTNNTVRDIVLVTVTSIPITTTLTTTTTTTSTESTTTTTTPDDNQTMTYILAGTGLGLIVIIVIWRRLKR